MDLFKDLFIIGVLIFLYIELFSFVQKNIPQAMEKEYNERFTNLEENIEMSEDEEEIKSLEIKLQELKTQFNESKETEYENYIMSLMLFPSFLTFGLVVFFLAKTVIDFTDIFY